MQRRRRPGGTATAAENWDFFFFKQRLSKWLLCRALGFVRKRICAIEFIWHRYATLLYLAAYLRQYGGKDMQLWVLCGSVSVLLNLFGTDTPRCFTLPHICASMGVCNYTDCKDP